MGLSPSTLPFFICPSRFRDTRTIAPPADGVGEPEQGPGLLDR
jgi:hypothetical protein